MPDIKIIVSHRIDHDSATPEPPVYLPIRSGAIFDTRSDILMQGDDTLDNISEKNRYFSEFTAQYWAWKNLDADYLGLCHYRRYFSFADKKRRTPKHDRMIHEALLDKKAANKYDIDNTDKIIRAVSSFDAIVPPTIEIRHLPTKSGIKSSCAEMWNAYTGYTANGKTFTDIILELIQKLHPKYLETAKNYLSGAKHRSFNCYILKKHLFNEMCDFEFDIMFAFEQKTIAECGAIPQRFIGYIGELLNGIYIEYAITEIGIKYKELQLVFFHNTNKHIKSPLFIRLKFRIKRIAEAIIALFFPRGSKRREKLKKILK